MDRADRQLGTAVGHAVRAHHRRRLERVGWLAALDAPEGGWAAGEPRQRPGGSLEILIDGAEALPRMVTQLAWAESHVHLAGWYFSPDFALKRDGEPAILRNLLAELAERIEVRVLVWAGAPLPLFRPSRGMVRRMRESLTGRGWRGLAWASRSSSSWSAPRRPSSTRARGFELAPFSSKKV